METVMPTYQYACTACDHEFEAIQSFSDDSLTECPKCKGEIYLNEKKDGLICEACKLIYEIRDDIPIMLIDEAKPI
jgi:hypothetical protein